METSDESNTLEFSFLELEEELEREAEERWRQDESSVKSRMKTFGGFSALKNRMKSFAESFSLEMKSQPDDEDDEALIQGAEFKSKQD